MPLAANNDEQNAPLLNQEQDVELGSLDESGRDSWDSEVVENGARSSKYAVEPRSTGQTAVVRLVEKYADTALRKGALLSFVLGVWALMMILLVVRASNIPPIGNYGTPKRLGCQSDAWPGNDIMPSCQNSESSCLDFISPPFAFQCPSTCGDAALDEEHYLGNRSIEYKPWIIGGAATDNSEPRYRGDSYICGAAIHAGIFKSSEGGCGILTAYPGQDRFTGSYANGMESFDFNSSFPLSFSVAKADEPSSRCYDSQWSSFAFSVLITILVSIGTESPSVFFSSTFVIAFFQTALVSDRPFHDTYLRVFQVALSRFLPAAFVAYGIYKFCVAYTLARSSDQIAKTVLWLSACWFGAIENYTLDKLPLSRLTPRDLQQPGAVMVLVSVVSIIAAIAIGQAWTFWKDGRFWKYLRLYGLLCGALAVMAFIPGLNLRIHHYILALLLLPGTAIRNRRSMLYQGLLVGLFINGVARWGFASILETDAFLARPGQLGGQRPFFSPTGLSTSNVTLRFAAVPEDWDGLSIVVNDVERMLRGRAADGAVFTWNREKTEDQYFRAAYFKMGYIGGIKRGDYTTPETWLADGTWLS